MDTNEIKKKLHSYRYIEFKIGAINEELNNLASMIDTQRNVKSPILTGLPRNNSISDTVGASAEKIIDKYCKEYARLENELDKLFGEKHEIDDLIRFLEGTEKQIIELYYFKKYKWWMVANIVNYSEKHCRRMRNSAIAKIREKTKKT